MWQVHTLAQREKIVASTLPEGITVLFGRRANPIVYMSVRLDGGELRVFNKACLPIITVDGAQILDLNECMEAQRALTDKDSIKHDYCFATGRSVGVCVWSGEDIITPSHPIWKIMHGDTLKIQVVFDPYAMAEYNISLIGFADDFRQAFGATTSQTTTSQTTTSQTFGATTNSVSTPPAVTIDRAAVRSMVEDFWRSFISVAATNPQIGAQSIQNFDDRIQATASLMVPDKARMFLRAIEEERDVLFNEYRRNPDALKRRLGLGPVNRSNLVVHHQRQSIG